jgi:hypothetical protein
LPATLCDVGNESNAESDLPMPGFAPWSADWPRAAVRQSLAVLLLAGCASPPMPLPPPGQGQDLAPCGAIGLQGLVGEPLARLPVVPRAQGVRLLRPGDPVTEDFSATRLNVTLDGNDIIAALTCG